ncbi:MAG: hypothetical protein ACTSPB_02260 [Candidatus Thorarchaeota archaeon]
MDFKKLKDKILGWFYDAGADWRCSGYQNQYNSDLTLEYYILEDEDTVTKGIVKDVMLDFWRWVDDLPELNKKYAAYKEATGKYITGYLHDLEESQ